MKLSKYLADYIEYELESFELANWIIKVLMEEVELHNVIREGIEAFESTEAVKVLVVSELIAKPIKLAMQNIESVDSGFEIMVVSKETAERIRELSE